MAEDEIIKHSKKAYKILKSKEMGFAHKLREIIIEIGIIVFAISLSLWLHNWSEARHDRKEEKEFLTGFKEDLKADIVNLTNSRLFYTSSLQGINYFLQASVSGNLDKDSINRYSSLFFSSTGLDPHIARYEGLKSSGKFKVIENSGLLNEIIDLQETTFQRINALNDKYYQHNLKLANLLEQNVVLAKNGQFTNPDIILGRSDFRIILGNSKGLITANNFIGLHDEGISKCREIIAAIDKEFE